MSAATLTETIIAASNAPNPKLDSHDDAITHAVCNDSETLPTTLSTYSPKFGGGDDDDDGGVGSGTVLGDGADGTLLTLLAEDGPDDARAADAAAAAAASGPS